MSNYTTQTAALKAVTIDTAKLDAKQIDTKKLFINGELFKESPNQVFMMFAIIPVSNGNYSFIFADENFEEIVSGDFQNNKVQVDFFELLSYFYPDRNISQEMSPVINLMGANFFVLQTVEEGGEVYGILEQCILDVQMLQPNGQVLLSIKLGEEDDNLTELYGGGANYSGSGSGEQFLFYTSIPYATPSSQTSTFSLRQPQNVKLSKEQIQEVFAHLRQQMLDKSAE